MSERKPPVSLVIDNEDAAIIAAALDFWIAHLQYEGEKIVVPRAHYAAGRYTVQRAIITRDAIRALLEGKT